jgi:hypothetical protein
MTPFFDDLETQLRRAAGERAGSASTSGARRAARRAQTWLRAAARGIPIAVAIATTIAIVVVALLLVRHGTGGPAQTPGGGPPSTLPNLSSPHARRELGYIEQATAATRRSPACRVRHFPRQSIIHGSPAKALLSILGVLRRPAMPADRLSPNESLGMPMAVYAGATRRALVAHGVSYYLIPARQDPSAGQPSTSCFAAQQAALVRALPTIPAALRAPTRALQARMIAFDRRLISQPPQDVICLATYAQNSGGASCGGTAGTIARGASSLQEDGNSHTVSGLVPDGVASVTLRFPAAGGRPARAVTTAVHGNVFAVRAAVPTTQAEAEPIEVLRSANGRVIRTITPPSRSAVAATCRRHPIQCVALSGATTEQASSSSSTVPAPSSATTGSR